MRTELISIIKTAGEKVRSSYYDVVYFTEKNPKDLVTDLDIRIENVIKHELLELFPDVGFYGEETGSTCTSTHTNHQFVLDPIDGTSYFIFGIPFFSISLAELKNNEVITAIVYNPMTNELFYADHSKQPAYLNNQPIRVSKRNKIKDMLAIMGFSADEKKIKKYITQWPQIFSGTKKTLPMIAPALSICSVAMGRADIFIDSACSFEGQVAAQYILKKAGGSVLNYDRSKYSYLETGIIASNGYLP